jgi:glyoxylase-like metal-dependent hydrolase (beta-lactamase superfamily II)
VARPEFVEIADRVWVARSDWYDLNITLIRGAEGLLVVDTHGSEAEGRRVVEDIRRLGVGEVTAVINTHEHFDHTFGNAAFRAAYGVVAMHAHEIAAANTISSGAYFKATYVDEPGDNYRDEVLATTIVPATETFSSARVLDLGDRLVELVYPGRGHSGGDLIVNVPGTDVLLAGDLVEESGPPVYGIDSWPMEWPLTLDIVLGLTTADSVIVPGHGSMVDRDFVEEQRSDIGIVAETIRDLAGRGIPVDDAVAAASWPFPREDLTDAVSRGYEHLPRSQKRLPLL